MSRFSRPLPSFAYISSLATEFGAAYYFPDVSDGVVFAYVGFYRSVCSVGSSRPVASAFGARCARLCGISISAWVAASDCLVLQVPISSARVRFVQVPPSGQWLVSAS